MELWPATMAGPSETAGPHHGHPGDTLEIIRGAPDSRGGSRADLRTRLPVRSLIEGGAEGLGGGAGNVTASTGRTAFFGRTFGEAERLLVEARDYLNHGEPVDRRARAPADRLLLCTETLRLTARLTQIMAWLLAQRAVDAGEMSREEALAEPLAALAICMDSDAPEDAGLPPVLADLLGRSRRLYVRVARLDELARRLH